MPAGQSAGNGIVIGAGPLCAPDTQYATLTRNTIQFRFSMQSAPSFFVCALHGCVCVDCVHLLGVGARSAGVPVP